MKLTTLDVDQLLSGVASRLVYEGPICASWPCWNDGTCLPVGPKNFTCICSSLFAGERCELVISDLCATAGCSPGSSCSPSSGWSGLCPSTSRDFISSCVTSSCLNGGTCEDTLIGHKCACAPPFHGPFCQYDAVQLGWTVFEIAMGICFLVLIMAAMAIICCSYNRNVGIYVTVPTAKNYDRWSRSEFSDEEEEDVIALGDLRKSGLKVSQTTETILDEASSSNPML